MISKTKFRLSFPGEETSLGRGGFPHISPWEMYHARPYLLTVFSITQSDRSLASLSILETTDLEIQASKIYILEFSAGLL
jgi:hypothetical protein